MAMDPSTLLFMQQAAQVPPDQAQLMASAQQPGADGLNAYLRNPAPAQQQASIPPQPQPHMFQDAVRPTKKESTQASALDAYLKPKADDSDPYGYKAAQAAAGTQTVQGQKQIQDSIDMLRNMPGGFNFAPVAAAIAGTNKGSEGGIAAAKDAAPMSADDKAKLLASLQMQLGKEQMTGAQDNLKGIQSQMNFDRMMQQQAETNRHNQAMEGIGGQKAAASAANPRGMAMVQGAIDRTEKNYDNDNLVLGPAIKQRNLLGTDYHTLTTPGLTITPQIQNEITTGMASALSGGKAAGLGQAQMQEINDAQTRVAKILSDVTSSPQQSLSADQAAQMRTQLERLDKRYGDIISARADQLHQGRHYVIPEAQAADNDKHDYYKQLGQSSALTGMNGGMAPAAPKEGDTKTYGGKTYTVVGGHWVAQ